VRLTSTVKYVQPVAAARVSIIVPVFNEAALIRNCLTNLRLRAPEAEIIVVDGGSTDETRERAADLCDQSIVANRSRAIQMNAGARVAHGEILWFVHVGVEVQPRCLDEITRTLNDPEVAGGYFRIRLPPDRSVYRLTDNFAHYAGWLLRIRCGDHGIFCRRDVFEKLGGFPEVPLMEDVEFFRAMYRYGRVCNVGERLRVSARHYEAVGPLRLTLAYGLIATLYALGVPLGTLSLLYDTWCCRHR
jgi:rSAM/selenodomain-associated transferase 2